MPRKVETYFSRSDLPVDRGQSPTIDGGNHKETTLTGCVTVRGTGSVQA
jgi:hypothetical protein